MNPYALPTWAQPTRRKQEYPCECGLMPIVAQVGKLYEVCWACLVYARLERGELTYKEADNLARLILTEYHPRVPRPTLRDRRRAAPSRTRIEKHLERLRELARIRPMSAEEAAEVAKVPERDARLALLLMEASGILALSWQDGKVVYEPT